MTCLHNILEEIKLELAQAAYYAAIAEALAKFDYSGIDEIAEVFLS